MSQNKLETPILPSTRLDSTQEEPEEEDFPFGEEEALVFEYETEPVLVTIREVGDGI